jgi:glycosyltransferase involved in cell wall biosynthesis
MTRVDVIVPCYQYGHYLETCVRTILDQQGVDVRVLIIDDCSTDDSAAVGAALARADHRVEFRRHDINVGNIRTYNEGIVWASAPYVLILSADDALTRGALKRAADFLEANRTASFVFGEQIPFTIDLPVETALDESIYDSELIPYQLFLARSCELGHTGIRAPTVVVRTAAQHEVGMFLEALPHAGDTEIWLRLAAWGPVGRLGAVQAFRRLHATNMGRGFAGVKGYANQLEAFVTHFDSVVGRTPGRTALENLVRETISRDVLWDAVYQFDRGSAADSAQCRRFALETWPPLRSTSEWRRLTVKRLLGRTLCRVLARFRDAARRLVTAPRRESPARATLR